MSRTTVYIEEDLEGEAREPLVEFLVSPPRIRHEMDPELQAILASLQTETSEESKGRRAETGGESEREPEPERVAQVVIDQGRVLHRPDFEEGQSRCLDQLFEDLGTTGCLVIDAPVLWDEVRVHRLTCVSITARLSGRDYLRDNVFFYFIRDQPSSDVVVSRMAQGGRPQLCQDELSRVHGVLPVEEGRD